MAKLVLTLVILMFIGGFIVWYRYDQVTNHSKYELPLYLTIWGLVMLLVAVVW